MVELEKKLSVVIVTFNHERYIAEAIDSVLMQKVDFSYEILIGDDGSADKTPEIVKEYADQWDCILPICRDENIGPNRNAFDMLMRTKGEYIAFLDGDDYWTDPLKLQTQVDFLDRHREFIGCTHRITIVDEEGRKQKDQFLPWVRFKKRFTLADFDGVTLPGQASTLVRRNLFVDSDIDMSVIYHTHPMVGDRTSVLIFLCNGDFGGIDRDMGCYRRYNTPAAGNITSKIYLNNENRIREEMDLTENLETIAWNLFHKKTAFDPYKRTLFVSALYQYLQKPNAVRKEAVRYTYRHNKNKILCIAAILPRICKKVWNSTLGKRGN